MLFAVSGLENCPIEGTDGPAGVVRDFLFDDQAWKIRWMAVETSDGRRVLVHASAIVPIELPPKPQFPMLSAGPMLTLSVALSRSQIAAGPEAPLDDPVTRQMESLLYDYYGLDPYRGGEQRLVEGVEQREAEAAAPPDDGEPRLHGAAAFKGFSVHASDGDVGHVEMLLADDSDWRIRYLVIATRNWLAGRHVQLAPDAVKAVDWFDRRIDMNVARERVISAPAWDPLAMMDDASEAALRRHFGWPG